MQDKQQQEIEKLAMHLKVPTEYMKVVLRTKQAITMSDKHDAFNREREIIEQGVPAAVNRQHEKGKMTATMDIKEIGSSSEDFEVAYGEETIEIAFNPFFLIDGINMIDGKNVIISIEEPLKPILIKSEKDKNILYLLMPVRVS